MPVMTMCCGTPCIQLTGCPAEVVSDYVASFPDSISFGLCTSPPACSPSQASGTISLRSTCVWDHNTDGSDLCIGGWTPARVYFGPIFNVSPIDLRVTRINGCDYWVLAFYFYSTGIDQIQVRYLRRVASLTDTPAGTYVLDSISHGMTLVPCVGATADPTITVTA